MDKFKKYKHVTLLENETLFYEGDLCKSIGFVNKGELKISSFLADGNEVIFNTIKENGIFGNNLVFSNKPFYRGNVIALTNCDITLLSKDELLDLLQSDRDFLNDYLNKQSEFSMTLNFRIKLISFDSAYDRLIYFLKYNNNFYTYKTITELSSLLHLKRETLSRLISKLERNNEIIVKNKTIALK